jgi:hypothetical protein
MWRHEGRALPPDWRQRRHQAWLTAPRDSAGNVLCGLCDQPVRRGQPYEVDHALAKDDHRIESLRVVHPACHKIRTQEQAAAARQPRTAITARLASAGRAFRASD